MLLRRHFVAGADARHCRGSGLGYDPRGRLFQISTSSTSRFLYDGTDIIAEYSGAGTLLRRYVHGTGHDEPIVWYEGAGTNDRRSLVADERGSIVAVTNSTGALLAINTYDAFGQPGAANLGRFQFTGQIWMAELGLYHDKARAYSPALGRFLQPDPLRYNGGMNLYAYVGNDPVNTVDPTGLEYEAIEPVEVKATREDPWAGFAKYLLLAQIREMDSGGRPRIRDDAREPQSNQTPCSLVAPSGNFKTGRNAIPLFQPDFADRLSDAIGDLNDQGIVPTMTDDYRTLGMQDDRRAQVQSAASPFGAARGISAHQVGLAVDFGFNQNAGNNNAIRQAMSDAGFINGSGFRPPDPIHYTGPGVRQSQNSGVTASCAATYAATNGK